MLCLRMMTRVLLDSCSVCVVVDTLFVILFMIITPPGFTWLLLVLVLYELGWAPG